MNSIKVTQKNERTCLRTSKTGWKMITGMEMANWTSQTNLNCQQMLQNARTHAKWSVHRSPRPTSSGLLPMAFRPGSNLEAQLQIWCQCLLMLSGMIDSGKSAFRATSSSELWLFLANTGVRVREQVSQDSDAHLPCDHQILVADSFFLECSCTARNQNYRFALVML